MQLNVRPLETRPSEESCTDEESQALSIHLEEGYQQAISGNLIDGDQARNEIQVMKGVFVVSDDESADCACSD